MVQTTRALKKSKDIDSYKTLREHVERVLREGRAQAERTVERIKTKTYWSVGKLIDRYILKHKKRAAYGDEVVKRLARDLNVSQTVLYYALEFARTYKIFPTSGKLGWSHYRELLEIEDLEQRRALARRAVEGSWSVRALARRVDEIERRKDGTYRAPSSFKSKLGKAGCYTVVDWNGELHLDLGFSTFVPFKGKRPSGLKAGDVIQVKSPSKIIRLPTSELRLLYTYRVQLERVVDGDTLWMRIDLGFGVKKREKLRLRGVDAPELQYESGRQAKAFVEDFFKGAEEVIITTTKPDKYDRYLTDIWVGEENLNQLLLASGHARLSSKK